MTFVQVFFLLFFAKETPLSLFKIKQQHTHIITPPQTRVALTIPKVLLLSLSVCKHIIVPSIFDATL